MHVKPDRDKVHHLFNGIRNNKVDQTTAMHGLEVEFNKALTFIAGLEEQVDLLTIERDAAREERDHALKAKDKTLPKDKTRGKDPTTSGDPTLPTDPTLSDGTNRF